MQLEIKGRSWMLVWGLGALELLCDELGISLQDIDYAILNNDTKLLNRLVYCALQNGAEIEDKSLDFNYKFFLNWLSEAPEETGKDIMNDFLSSKLLGKTVKDRFEEMVNRMNATLTESDKTAKKKSIH